MKAFATGLVIVTAILASAPVAMAEYFVPPSNSAATQYTEAVPTAGGGHDTKAGGSKHAAPVKVLGYRNAKKLDAQGPEGRAAAEVAAAAAPTSPMTKAANGQNGQVGNTGNGPKGSGSQGTADSPATLRTSSPDPSGSSAVGEIAGRATGLSTDQSSLLLPLLIVAAIAWSLIYAVRQRKRPAVTQRP